MNKIKCLFGFHSLLLEKSLSESSDLVRCENCNKRFAVNYSARISLKWDRSLEKFYEEFDRL